MNSELHTNRSSTIGLCNDFKIEKWPTLMLFQTCMTYFSLLNTKEDIWTAVTFILWTKNTLQYNSSFKLYKQSYWFGMNEWMHLCSALLCIAVHQKRFTIMWGSLLHHHQCAASTWVRWLPQYNGTSAVTTQLQVERRESHRANQVNGGY